ncbi:hypothetical protein L218DRAFT_731563 [Marasmius fiardii PR-910]|nr:hypothetical protein L218DRAFT_731563 [Marasmius fiardii PR-910]
MTDLTSKLIESLREQQFVSYVEVASAALFIYEVLINISVEIEYIWTKKWSFLTVLYVLQRYLPFLDTVGLGLQRHLGAHLNAADCMLNYQIAGWSIIAGLMLSEIVLTIRAWAVWERSVPIAIGLVIFFLACWIPGYVLHERFLSTMEFIIPFPNFHGCIIVGGGRLIFLSWVLMMIYDVGALVMLLIPDSLHV